MLGDLVPVLIMLTIFGTIYKIFELFVCRQERLRLIEKIAEVGAVDTSKLLAGLHLPTGKPRHSFAPLRWGLLALGVGLGTLVAFFIMGEATNMNYFRGETGYNWQLPSVVYSACICLFGGIGLVGSYLIERKESKRTDSND